MLCDQGVDLIILFPESAIFSLDLMVMRMLRPNLFDPLILTVVFLLINGMDDQIICIPDFLFSDLIK